MAQLTASRTLVKSSPELWAECSDAASLARHLGAFGEIHITKLEPETAVAWEGEDACGTVTLESSGWGTHVVLTAEVLTPVGVGEPAGDVAAVALESDAVVETDVVTAAESGPVAVVETAPEPESVAVAGPDSVAAAEPARPGFFRRLFGGWRRPADPVPVPDPDPVAESPDVAPVRARSRPPIARVAPEPADPAEPESPESVKSAEPAAPAKPDSRSAEALAGALDSLGRAHRRPFSHG